jgi:hypothetical protein
VRGRPPAGARPIATARLSWTIGVGITADSASYRVAIWFSRYPPPGGLGMADAMAAGACTDRADRRCRGRGSIAANRDGRQWIPTPAVLILQRYGFTTAGAAVREA